MDPLSVTTSVIAVTTLAFQSCQTARKLVDGFVDAPQAISRSRAALAETQKTLLALQEVPSRVCPSAGPCAVYDQSR